MTDQPGWTRPGAVPEPPGQPTQVAPGVGAPPGSLGGPQPPPGYRAPGPGWGPPPGPPPPPKPGVIPLRPLGIGEVLDGAITSIRTHPKAMLGLSLLVAVVVQVLTVPLVWLLLRGADLSLDPQAAATPGQDVALLASTYSAAAIQGVVTLIAVLFLTGMLTVVVSRAVLGEPTDLTQAWQQARPRLPALFGVTFLVALIGFGILAIIFAPALLLAVVGAPAPATVLAGVVGIPLAIVLIVYVYVVFALAPAAVVLERQRVWAALRRSRALVRGAWWRTFWILLLVNIIAGFISAFLSMPFMFGSMIAAFAMGGGDSFDMFGLVPLMISAVGSIIGATITWPFTAAATVLVYVDRRIRREGLDLELTRAARLAPRAEGGWSPAPGSASGPSYGG